MFDGKYHEADTLREGKGYWVKISQTDWIESTLEENNADTIEVNEGWNLVGSITDTVDISVITSIPPGIVTSPFYEYENGEYAEALRLAPWKGYWVKTREQGHLILLVE